MSGKHLRVLMIRSASDSSKRIRRSPIVGALVGVVLLTSPALAQKGSRTPKPFAAFSASALSLRDSIVVFARAQSGTRYRLGGQSPEKGFDCSGFVRYVLSALHVELPRTAATQADIGVAVPKDTARLRPGDLLTFGRGNRITHVGIYVGDGHFVHASTKAGRVIESSLDRPGSSLIRNWRGARRVVASAEE
jgi:cell wall-associated NlpC family hydrolase